MKTQNQSTEYALIDKREHHASVSIASMLRIDM